MAMDTLAEKTAVPCGSATQEELDKKLQAIYGGSSEDLKSFVRAEASRNIRWEKVRHLRIVGDDNHTQITHFKGNGIPRGFHLSGDGSWLLVLLPEKPHLGDYFSRCGEYLESLAIMNTRMYTRDWSKFPALVELYLQDNPMLDTLEQLGWLGRLERLMIHNCPRLTTISDLGKLTRLTSLNLFGCDSLTELPGLENLKLLTSLDLVWCASLTELPGLEKLTRLTTLNLVGCKLLNVLPGLENLKLLTSLNLSGCKSLTELSGLENLKLLTSLNLSGCKSLTMLSGLENLTRLTSLNLWECKSLTKLPGLKNLTQLTSLNLSQCSFLTELPELESLKLLSSLDLSLCKSLTALPGLGSLKLLTSLSLFACSSLTELPEEIRHMKSLRMLDLRFMTLRTLPDWLPEIAEGFSMGLKGLFSSNGKSKAIVYLGDTTVEDIPDMSIFDQPFEVIEDFFRQRSLGQTQMLNEIKVVFLGDGEAGKSHTIARLMNDGGTPVDYVDSATPGIVIKDLDYTVDGRTFRVHYWDFGGQEIMHSMHRIFLTGRTMYVVLLNARDDTQGDRAHYWLHNIQSFAPGAPVLLVLNKIDQNPKASVDERTLRSRYPGLTQIVKLSARDFSREDFNKTFTEVLLEEIKNTGYLDAQWPGSWIRVKERLENMDTHYILGNEYRKICRECQVNDLQADLLHWFNDLGVSFCFCDREDYTLKKHVILRPDWITNGLYIILFNECPGANNGQIPHEAIYDLLERASHDRSIQCTLPEASYDNPGDVEYVLGVMRKFQLSLDSRDGNEFIPMLCKQDSTIDIHYYEKDTELLEFSMDFEYLPDNLLHRLMVERYAELDRINAWRKGARFELKELGLSAVVVIDGRHLRFFIRHTNTLHRPNTYLAILKANVDRIVAKMGLTPPECVLIYKHEGKTGTFDYEELLQAREDHEQTIYSKVWRKRIAIDNILKQSAPDTLEDETKLLNEILRSCRSIQDEPIYRLIRNDNGRGYVNGTGMEDLRNRRVRDDLIRMGFKISDQPQRGSSGSGTSVGELDMLVLNERGESWTIIEALRVSDGTKKPWNDHLDKLLNKYNTRGLPRLYLLTYVDADPTSFASIWRGYQAHIKKQNPAPYTYAAQSFEDQNGADDPRGIRAAKCRYTCGGDPVTVYHIFARIPTQNG